MEEYDKIFKAFKEANFEYSVEKLISYDKEEIIKLIRYTYKKVNPIDFLSFLTFLECSLQNLNRRKRHEDNSQF